MKLFRNKKILLIFSVLLAAFFPKNTASQTILLDPAEFYIGPTFGINGSMMLFSPKVLQTYQLGYTGGLAFRYITEEHFGLQVEINYSQRGFTEEGGVYSRQFNYVELPFLTHYYLGDTHRFIFNLGPKLSYMFEEKVLFDDGSNPEADQRVLLADKKLDYGIAAGFGYNLHTKKMGVFQWELRAYYGLADVFPNTKSDFFSTSNYLNVSVNLGWFFQVTGRKKEIITDQPKSNKNY